jgi:hypothetical protein
MGVHRRRLAGRLADQEGLNAFSGRPGQDLLELGCGARSGRSPCQGELGPWASTSDRQLEHAALMARAGVAFLVHASAEQVPARR